MRRSTDRAARIAEKTNSLNKNFRIKTKPMSNNILRNSELISGQASYQLTPIQNNSAMQQNRNQQFFEEIHNPEYPAEFKAWEPERNEQLLPEQTKPQFYRQSQRILVGQYSVQRSQKKNNGPDIDDRDCIGNFGLYLTFDNWRKKVHTDGKYNSRYYKVEKGFFMGRQAYRVNDPQKKPSVEAGSYHAVCFKSKQARDFTLYVYRSKQLHCAQKVTRQSVKPNQWILFKYSFCSFQYEPYIFLIVPTQTELKLQPAFNIGNGVTGATRHKDSNIIIELVRFSLPAQPPRALSYYFGPDSHKNMYTINREIILIESNNKQKEYLIWSQVDSKRLYLTELDRLRLKQKTIQIQGKTDGYIFAAACGNGKGQIFYAQVEKGPKGKSVTLALNLVKCSIKGDQLRRESVKTDENHANLQTFDACQLAYNNGKVAMFLTRRMTPWPDGLNHQGAYAAIFDSQTLKLIKQVQGASSHCFAMSMLANKFKPGSFIGIDLGDNYPRGINHWYLDESYQRLKSKVVYTFKTQHGKEPQNPSGQAFPEYKQLSAKLGKKYYQWSNDNHTYTQLAAPGIVNHETGNIVVFSGQNINSSLDDKCVGTFLNCARNVGFVKQSKDLDGPILSKGVNQKGGFYKYRGQWTPLQNIGIKWLTKFTKLCAASRVKAVQIKGKVFIIYQYWEDKEYVKYMNTQYIIVDENGQIIVESTPISFDFNLHRADDIYVKQNSVLIYVGEDKNCLSRYQIMINPQLLI